MAVQTSRRTFLQAAAVTGASAALTLAPLRFANADNPPTAGSSTATITGHLKPGAADWVYLPVEIPRGVAEIAVSYTYSKPTVPTGTLTNSCDIGIFDQRGIRLGGRGFRGWSGGFRTEFTIAADAATPGYLPGPIERGTWHVILGPYQVSPLGLDYSVTVTLTFGPDRTPAFTPHYPPQSIPGTGPGWYRGDNHLHTVYSDGKRTPEEVAAGARAAGLNFMSTTDHNTSSSHGVWGPLAGDDLLILTGEEITTRNGHVLALGLHPGRWVDWRYRAADDEIPGDRPVGPGRRRHRCSRTSILPIRRMPLEIRLPRRRRHRSVERPLDPGRRIIGGHLGRATNRRRPGPRPLVARDG